jgi:2-methylisocitrate lyase-like PEP mutase family enzyme
VPWAPDGDRTVTASKAERIRIHVRTGATLVMPGVYDALSAQLAESSVATAACAARISLRRARVRARRIS